MFRSCDLAASIASVSSAGLMDHITRVPSFRVADLLLEYLEAGQRVISLYR